MPQAQKSQDKILRALGTTSEDDSVPYTLDVLVRETDLSANDVTANLIEMLRKGFIHAWKLEDDFGNLPYDFSQFDDPNYNEHFFGSGVFHLSLKDKGRERFAQIRGNKDSPSDELDDKLPILRAKFLSDDVLRLAAVADKIGDPLGVVFIDIDHFKQVNDTHTHAVGDAVLIGVAELLNRRLRGKGKAYRYGGDELVVLLPNYCDIEAVGFAEAVRRDVEQSSFSEHNLHVTVSLGVAVYPTHASDAKELVRKADETMYDAKQGGRNRVRYWGETDQDSIEKMTVLRTPPSTGSTPNPILEEIRRQHFVEGIARCPNDQAQLRVIDAGHMGEKTPTIIVMCPLCGFQESIPGLPLDTKT